MILPTSPLAGILLLVIGLICWGVWANTFKAAGKWRYEYYYVDFAAGTLLCALIVAFTFGSWNASELTFQDNFLIASYRRITTGLGAGVIFGLANTLLLASLSVAGMAVAISISLCLATVVTLVVNLILGVHDASVMRLGGAALLVISPLLIAVAYVARQNTIAEAAKKDALQPDPRSKQARLATKPSRTKGIMLATISGLFMGFVSPVLDLARQGESGVAPYGLGVLVAVGLAGATVLSSPFVITFPVIGLPATIRDYFRGTLKQHLLGLLGGILWGTGMFAYFVSAGSPAGAQVAVAVRTAMTESPALIAALTGMLVWREFQGAPERARSMLLGFLVAYAAGLVMISLA